MTDTPPQEPIEQVENEGAELDVEGMGQPADSEGGDDG